MNERIKQLAQQAGFELQVNCGPLEGEGEIYYAKEFEKFAELIVQECAQIADDGFGSAHFGLGISGRMLKEHFEIDTQTE